LIFWAKYNTQTTFSFPMVKRAVVDLAVSADWTPAAADSAISKDQAAFADTTNTVAAVGGSPTRTATGWKITLTATELSAAQVDLQIVDAATKAVEDQFITIYTYGNASAKVVNDWSDAVRMGMTALPNATPGAAGGLLIAGTNVATTFNGVAASGATPATAGLTISGGAASTTGGGVSAAGIVVTGGAGAGSTNGAASGATFAGGGTNTVASTADGIKVTGTSTGHGLDAQSGAGATGNGINAVSNATNGSGITLTKAGSGSDLNASSTPLILAKTTNITGFNDIAATDVVSAGAITTSGGAVSTVTTATAVTTVNGLAANVITAASIAADAITAAKIADGAIDAATFAAGAINASAIAADAITAAKIADGAIDAATFAAGAINAAAIAADAITAAKIADGAIDAATFAASAIDATAIASNAITAAKIADGAIDRATLAADTGLQTIRSNTAASGAATTITLDASASATDDFYNNTYIYITGGTGVGQARFISDYVGATKVATVNSAWVTNPANDSTFAIIPFSTIPGASAPTAADVADAVWDEAQSGHTTAGTFGKFLDIEVSSRGTGRYGAGRRWRSFCGWPCIRESRHATEHD
jgi:hypothetical protein